MYEAYLKVLTYFPPELIAVFSFLGNGVMFIVIAVLFIFWCGVGFVFLFPPPKKNLDGCEFTDFLKKSSYNRKQYSDLLENNILTGSEYDKMLDAGIPPLKINKITKINKIQDVIFEAELERIGEEFVENEIAFQESQKIKLSDYEALKKLLLDIELTKDQAWDLSMSFMRIYKGLGK